MKGGSRHSRPDWKTAKIDERQTGPCGPCSSFARHDAHEAFFIFSFLPPSFLSFAFSFLFLNPFPLGETRLKQKKKKKGMLRHEE